MKRVRHKRLDTFQTTVTTVITNQTLKKTPSAYHSYKEANDRVHPTNQGAATHKMRQKESRFRIFSFAARIAHVGSPPYMLNTRNTEKNADVTQRRVPKRIRVSPNRPGGRALIRHSYYTNTNTSTSTHKCAARNANVTQRRVLKRIHFAGRRWLQDTSKRKLADFLISLRPPFLFPRVLPSLTR